MQHITVSLLDYPSNPAALASLACNITQKPVSDAEELIERYTKYTKKPLVKAIDMCINAEHNTPLELNNYVIAITGASRRFLAQIRTYRVGITFVSGSLQYQNVEGSAKFVVPYNIAEKGPGIVSKYLQACEDSLDVYKHLINKCGVGHDEAAYALPQSLRNTLLISTSARELRHILAQRLCRRNTEETRYVCTLLLMALMDTPDAELMFKNVGPACVTGKCDQGKMCCGKPFNGPIDPMSTLLTDWPLYRRGDKQ